nr:protein MANNAN SYNTHESIS-RELATED 1-like [Ipomoea batatas]
MSRNIAYDLKHILSGFLTASMLLMLCNMIKTDHIDPLLGNFSAIQPITPNNGTKSPPRVLISSDPWGLNKTKQVLNPCWRKSTNSKPQESRGLIFVTLAQDPEYHVSQIATAVVVAKYLGATLVIPNIRQSASGQKRMFGEIYDLEKFTESLDEKVMAQGMDSQIAKIYNQRVTTVKVPNMVSLEFIKSNIEPIFKSTRNLRLSIYFPSTKEQTRMSPYGCLGTFDTLMLRPELQKSINSMIKTLRSLNPNNSEGRFVAVDYKVVETMPQSSDSSCPQEIAHFLKKIGFENGTTIYLTLNGWHTSIEHLTKVFPNTFTKDAIIPADEKSKFLDPERPELKQIVDFYVSSAADVYVPTSSNLFSDNVVARRIATGKRQVLVPANRSSLSAEDYVPPYILEKEHWAYSCFC